MNRLIITIFTLLAALFASPVYAQEKKMRVAILDPVSSEKDDGMKLIVREIVSGCFVNYGDNYAIVERSQLDKIMQEAKFTNTGAVDEAQATELGKLAGADKIVLTVISKMGTRCMLSVKMIDVETATVEKQHSKIVKYDSMVDVIEPLTLVLLGKKSANILGEEEASLADQNTQSPKIQDNNNQDESSSSKITDIFKKKPKQGITGKVESCIWLQPAGFQSNERYFDEFANKRELIELENQKEVSVVFDYSQTYIADLPLKDYLEYDIHREGKKGLTFVEELNIYTPEVEGRFMDALNEKFKKIRFTQRTGNPYTLVVRLREIDKPGRKNRSEFIFFETKNGKPIGGVSLKSTGGRFGGFTNLFGDAFEEEAAPQLAKMLKNQFKNFRK